MIISISSNNIDLFIRRNKVYKILVGVLISLFVSTAALAQADGAYMSSKPAACMNTNAMFKKFNDDKNEQVIFKYEDPLHNTIGVIYYNTVLNVVHAVELAPARGGTTACVIVFGNKVTATTWKLKE